MTKSLSILIILLALGCGEKANENYKLPNNIDVSDMLSNIIESDSLTTNPKEQSFVYLKKFEVIFTQNDKPYPPKLDQIYDFEIRNIKINLANKDVKYIKFQNDTIVNYQLSDDLLDEISLVDKDEIEGEIVYVFSVPIFTLNNKIAYVKRVTYISGNFLDCRAYHLQKKDSKWEIIKNDILFSH